MTNDSRSLTRQLQIIHLSDLHFGGDHRFNVPATTEGDRPTRRGYPTLLEKLKEDLEAPKVDKLLICLTGDFAHTADYKEFKAAEEFIKGLIAIPLHGKVRDLECVYIVPGNHDVGFTKSDMGERWERYAAFANRIHKTNVADSDPWGLITLSDRVDDLGAVVLSLNSAIYVEKGTPNEKRGEVDVLQLKKVEEMLEGLATKRNLREAIRIALIHHHPVLIPALAEPGRGYDAVENSGGLLTILRRYGFHMILHGHKHNPFVFVEDSESAWVTPSQPIVISAGGSISSMSIPGEYKERSNCYNRITVKWHPAAQQTRISVETRGLSVFNADGKEDLPQNWVWRTLKQVDKQFYASQCMPSATPRSGEAFDTIALQATEADRTKEYARARGNMPVVEVLPSLVAGQAYEARAWIVGHPNPAFPRELPLRVTWSAGVRHRVFTVNVEEDERFCVAFHYWDSMLLQAKLEFKDKRSEVVHIYARLPENYSSRLKG